MSDLLFNSVCTLSGIAVIAGAVLFFAAKKFKVFEDPKIAQVDEILPAANCGGCGYAGCRNFAEATVAAKDLDGLFCPVGGSDLMQKVAAILGHVAPTVEPRVAVLRCNGSRANAPQKIVYQGAKSCSVANAMFAGESGCAYGCLGLADCVDVCAFDALKMDTLSGLPVVIREKCTSCGACIKACPRNLFELRPQARDVYVACMNKEKGAASKKNCSVACIGCSRCVKFGDKDHIKIENFLSYIDCGLDLDKFGPEVIGCCPTKAIIGVGVVGKKPEAKEATKTE